LQDSGLTNYYRAQMQGRTDELTARKPNASNG